MFLSNPIRVSLISGLVLAASLACGLGSAQAAPPAAASHVKVFTTRDISAGEGNAAFSWWHVTWQDNALDEEGYLVRGRYLLRGRPVTPYYVFAREAPNSTYAIFSLADQSPDISMQFQVVAFKHNGTRLQTRVSKNQGKADFANGTAFNKPEDLTISRVQGTDGLYDLSWKDRSSTEIYHLLSYKKSTSATWNPENEYQVSLFGESNVRRAISLAPATTYHMRMRAQRFGPNPALTDYSNLVVVTTEPLATPSHLSILIIDDETIQLNWQANSYNAMGYELQSRNLPAGNFQPLTDNAGNIYYTGGNENSFVINIPPGADMEWRVRGVFQDNDEQNTLHHSEFSNIASVRTEFPAAPTGVAAVATGLSGSIAVKWDFDTALASASQFIVVGRPAGSGTGYSTLATVPAGTHEALISDLLVDQPMEVAVTAVGVGGGSSRIVDTVEVTPRAGFNPARYVANLDPDDFGMVLLNPLREEEVYTGPPDADADGVPDAHDSHPSNPNLWCDWNNNGVNDNEEEPINDQDGDGVADEFDSHPQDPNLWCDWNNNGINDSDEEPDPDIQDADGDGVADEFDSHPEDSSRWSDWNNNGVNDNEEVRGPDSDGDGVTDDHDSHPEDPSLWCDWNDNGVNDNEESGATNTIVVAHDLVRGAAFEHLLSITASAERDSWSVTGLPEGFSSFDDSTGGISGAPDEAGIVLSPATVLYQNGVEARAKLVFRIQQPPASPLVAESPGDRTIGTNSSLTLPLVNVFKDPDTPRAARLHTTLGNVTLALSEDITPQAVANFLAYVRAGDYDGVAFHRSVPGFVVQGGGFKPTASPNEFESVNKRPSPRNEPGVSNVRGTIAAAKVGSDPNSATHDFFLNLGDNRENLDRQNRGFTVFGRVLSDGMAVADAIAGLPRGDFGVVVDGQPAWFQDWPLEDEEIPEEMDIDKTVRILSATEIHPLSFAIQQNSNPAAVHAVINGTQVVLTGLNNGSSNITIRAIDLEGNTAVHTFTVHAVEGHEHPSITGHPQSQLAPPNSQVVFTVQAEGTGIQYQWRKNGAPLDGQNGASLTLEGVAQADEGEYDVVVSSATTTLTSAKAVLQVSQEALITTDLTPQIVPSGQPLVLTLGVAGQPEPQVIWFKNDLLLPQTGPVLAINPVTLADHGLYRAQVSNSTGTAMSVTVPVVVVDGSAKRLVVKQGGNASLTAHVASPPGIPLSYQWKNGSGANVPLNGRFSGVTTPKLSINSLNAVAGPDTYTCVVSGPSEMGSAVSGPFEVIVAAPPQITQSGSLPNARVGQDYEHFIAFNPAKALVPTAFTVSGLPRGLKLERSTGRIHGRPVVAGTYPLRIRASNPGGASAQISASLLVIPMPATTTGSFIGMIERDTVVNDDCGGRIDLSVTDNGAFSARLTLAAGAYQTRGTVTRTVMAVTGTPVTLITGTSTIKRRNLPALTLNFRINAANSNLAGELSLDEDNTASLTGWKKVWHKTYQPPAEYGYPGLYHFSMTIPAASTGLLNIPQGAGYASLTVNDSGTATVRGRTIDNKPLLCSAPLGPAGSFMVFQLLYNKRGSLLGPLGIAQQDSDLLGFITHSRINNVSGFPLDHFKNTAQPHTMRDYRAGFNPAIALDVKGGNYVKPPTGTRNAIARLNATGFLDASFGSPLQADGAIMAMRAQNGNFLVGGFFSTYNGKPCRGLARLQPDGALDETFNPGGSGPNGAVYDIAIDSNGKILIGGNFTQYNGSTRNRVARLNADGTLDASFNPGTGPNATVETVAIQANGMILIGGSFSTVYGVSKPGIARLTHEAALDNNFNTGAGVNAAVRRIVVLSDQRILLGGDFTRYDGTERGRLARINATGSLDGTFAAGTGANGTVRVIEPLSDDNILIGGAFGAYDGIARGGIARLTALGENDGAFNPGTGANREVRAIAVRPDGKLLVGGAFTRFDHIGSDNRNGVALLEANGFLNASFVPPSGSANNVRALLSVDVNKVLIGGWVRTADRSTRILGLHDSANRALIEFSHAKVGLSATNPNATFIVNPNNTALPFGSNPAATTWKFNANTGILSGRAILRDADTRRTVNFTALLVPVTPSDYRGLGLFDLPDFPDGITTTSKTSPIYTGRIDVRPAP